jgi:hypothetical protein
MEDTRFQLDILKPDCEKLKLGHDAAAAFAILKTHNADILFSITLSDIESYDWDRQILTMTSRATRELAQVLSRRGKRREDLQASVNMKEKLGWGDAISRALYIQPFRVIVDLEFIYGGIFLDAPSQRPIDYPVARVGSAADRATLAFLPIHMPFISIDPIDGEGNWGGLVIAEECRTDMEDSSAGGSFLAKWTAGHATSESACTFRRIVRNPKAKAVLEAAGKLLPRELSDLG